MEDRGRIPDGLRTYLLPLHIQTLNMDVHTQAPDNTYRFLPLSLSLPHRVIYSLEWIFNFIFAL